MEKVNIEAVTPDERGKIAKQTVSLENFTISRITASPGARWSIDVKPYAGTNSCKLRHTGIMLSGVLAVRMDDGKEERFGKNDVFVVPPGHDAWCVGEEDAVFVEFSKR